MRIYKTKKKKKKAIGKKKNWTNRAKSKKVAEKRK